MTDTIDNTGLPVHIGFIMDGNGRWATEQGLPRSAGHKKGAEAAQLVIEHAHKRGIKVVTLYAFSSENWKRPKAEGASSYPIAHRLASHRYHISPRLYPLEYLSFFDVTYH